MSGFVYLWFDKKHRRFYVGSHWGKEDDGYICSSNWMSISYKRRPLDFHRRIISRIATNRKDLFIEEQRWLSMIKPSELGVRYYNLKVVAGSHWTLNVDTRTIRQKMSDAGKKSGGFKGPHSEATRARLREKSTGHAHSEAQKAKQRSYRHTGEAKAKIAEASRGRLASPETRAKRSVALKGNKNSLDPNTARNQALREGQRFYEGDPCRKDHSGVRYASTRYCKECLDLRYQAKKVA